MKDNYVSNIQEILIANETQKNKIQFLQRERLKRDHYLEDLKQNLQLNKQTLRTINDTGPNLQTINTLMKQVDTLSNQAQQYYEQYQSINAVLLMEKQMRLEDRRFYNERMGEFENKMVDLRKYLHDKEDSFSSVVARLKKYEDLGENSMDDKLSNFKKEIGERHINEFITQILKEKNFYRNQYEKIMKDYLIYEAMKNQVFERCPEVQDSFTNYEAENRSKLDEVMQNIYRCNQIVTEQEKQLKESKDKKKKADPNKELIRLLKKEKLSKELHEEALNQAIEKNQELISIKDIYERSLEKLEKKVTLLYAQNSIFALRLAQYDSHYCRYTTHHQKYYEEGQKQGLRFITESRLKEYAKKVQQYFESDIDLYKKFDEKLRSDVEKWGEYICDSPELKRERDRKQLLCKSCSVPNLLVGFELDEYEEEDKMLIEQY